MLADDASARLKTARACSSRFGCFLCTSVDDDRSLDQMADKEEYAYMRPLARFRRFLINTRFDLSRRSWIGKRIRKDGWLTIAPSGYSEKMRIELLRYALSIDAEERISTGGNPRFMLVPEDCLVAIEAFWSLHGVGSPFATFRIWEEIYRQGKRYSVPNVPIFPRIPIPPKKYMNIGTAWQSEEYDLCGLRDPLMESAEGPCRRQTRACGNGRTVAVYEGSDFEVSTEWIPFLFEDYELRRMLSYRRVSRTYPFRLFLDQGIISVNDRSLALYDDILRRTSIKEDYGLFTLDTPSLYEQALTADEAGISSVDTKGGPTPSDAREVELLLF